MVINDNTDSEVVNRSFNYVKNIPKDTPSFLASLMSSPTYHSPILDAALNPSPDWGKVSSITEIGIDLNRPTTSGTDISRNDSVMGTVYNAIQNSKIAVPLSELDKYAEMCRNIGWLESNIEHLENLYRK